MGGGVIFITLSMRTEYNSKIKLMLGLAPATYIVHRPSQITKIMINNGQKLIVSQKRTFHKKHVITLPQLDTFS